MSFNFSANQYNDAFRAHRLQNYEIPSQHKQWPKQRQGHTTIISNDRGHLNPESKRSSESPWGSFLGTWHLKSRQNTQTNKLAANKSELDQTNQHDNGKSTPQGDMLRSRPASSVAGSLPRSVSATEENCTQHIAKTGGSQSTPDVCNQSAAERPESRMGSAATSLIKFPSAVPTATSEPSSRQATKTT